uniref:RRM domain-containing protein n=1 Tax=viral metagenome TaxID=1070528 RepID=A0A6C0CKG8_9ZZZZ
MKITNSLFIPRISFSVSKEDLRQYFTKYGLVCRVDFVSFNNNNGVGRRVYIHYQWYNFQSDMEIAIVKNGQYEIQNEKLGSLKIFKNKNPVPFTELNLDQVAYNTIFIGDVVQEQNKKIENLESKIQALETLVESLTRNNKNSVDL